MSFTVGLRRRVFQLLTWVPVGMVVTKYGYSVITVKGTSMQPTFNPDSSWKKDTVLLNRWVVTWGSPFNRGDVITMRHPTSPNLLIIKRILALEDDIVRTLPPYPEKFVRIPPGHAWVEGDEPFRSGDSNHFGPVSLNLVDARVEAILWPLDRAGPLPQHHQTAGLSAIPLGKGGPWRYFLAEHERARQRMERVYVKGRVGFHALEEDWRRELD